MPRNPTLTADLGSNLRDREPRIFLKRAPRVPRGTDPNNGPGRQAKRNGTYSRRQKARLFADRGQIGLLEAIHKRPAN